jgi:hypothetical protein
LNDPFTKEILYEIGEQDLRSQKCSDVTIYISTNRELVKQYLIKRHGEREWENDRWFNFISRMPPYVDQFMSRVKKIHKNVITIDRGYYDFTLESDKMKFFNIIERVFEK